MEIKTTSLKHCTLVQVIGKLDSSTAPSLTAEFKKVMDNGDFRIVMDMSKLEFISSAGLWVLVNTQKNCKRFNRGELVLAEVPAKIRGALDLAGFLNYFQTFDSSTEAVGSF